MIGTGSGVGDVSDGLDVDVGEEEGAIVVVVEVAVDDV